MTRVVCDKCAAIFDEADTTRWMFSPLEVGYAYPGDATLCRGCQEQFKMWLKETASS